jgi:tRNA G18 (ribose-2'-O)-methylase SpoU
MKKLSMDELNRKTVVEFKQSGKLPLVVVLENVRSLHNIGSIFRTCDAFLIESIYLCGISATPPHKEIHKTALGAEESVNWKYFESAMQAVKHLQANGYAVWGVEQTENSISLVDFSIEHDKRYALVFGNEVRGLEQDIVDCCEGCIEIPQFGTKHSFNVSVSAGIMLWECYKQISGSGLEMSTQKTQPATG